MAETPKRTYSHDGCESIACPHCGDVMSDLWEYGWRHGDIEDNCGTCGKPFRLTRDISVSYTAVALEPEPVPGDVAVTEAK